MLDRGLDPRRGRAFWGIVRCIKNIGAVYAKTAESIEMPFEGLTWMDQGNHVSVGVPILVGKGAILQSCPAHSKALEVVIYHPTCIRRHILRIYMSYDVFRAWKNLLGLVDTFFHWGIFRKQKFWGHKYAFSSLTRKILNHRYCPTDSNQILHSDKD